MDCKAGLLATFCLSCSIRCITQSNHTIHNPLFIFLIYYRRKIYVQSSQRQKPRTYMVHTPVGAFQERNGQALESPLLGRKSRGLVAGIQEALQVNLRSENQIIQVNMGFWVLNSNSGSSCLACSNAVLVVWTCTWLTTGHVKTKAVWQTKRVSLSTPSPRT